MSKKKIEPTDAMVDEAANILCLDATHASLRFHAGLAQRTYRNKARAVMRTALSLALNHPDAPGLFADEDDRPWDPLVRYHPLNVGDEVRQDRHDLTITGVVGSVDGRGNPRTTEGALIGHLNQGSWWVRHAARELPTKPGAVIVPADGHERIEAVSCGDMYYAREAILSGKGDWHAAWRSDAGVLVYVASERVTPGTWKVDDK